MVLVGMVGLSRRQRRFFLKLNVLNCRILRGVGLVGTFRTLLWALPTWGPHLALNTKKIFPVGKSGDFLLES